MQEGAVIEGKKIEGYMDGSGFWSIRPEVFYKKVLLRFSQNLQEKKCTGVSFLIKLQLQKRNSETSGSLWSLQNFKNISFVEHLWMAASVDWILIQKNELNLLTYFALVKGGLTMLQKFHKLTSEANILYIILSNTCRVAPLKSKYLKI